MMRSHALAKTMPLLLLFSAACEDKTPKSQPPSPAPAASSAASTAPPAAAIPKFDPNQLMLFAPLPEAVEKPVLDDIVKLGQMLYFDTRLSKKQDVSCATCHDLEKAGAVFSKKSRRNVPTVLNAGGAFAQGWDARTSTIEEFILPHLLDSSIGEFESEKKVTDLVESIPGYVAAFKKAFPDEKVPITSDTIGRALGGYTKKLFARSRWDKFLAGDKEAVKDDELAGLAMFVEAGCTSCHQGKYLGATQTQKLGIAKPWPGDAGADQGRFAHTKQEADRGQFKVPSLRNVTRTGPYLHDGSVTTLNEITRLMARHQVGKELSEPQVEAIIKFFGTLTGDPPKELSQKPTLPPSGPKTPPRPAAE